MKNKWQLSNILTAIILLAVMITAGSLLGTYVKNRQPSSVSGIEDQAEPVVIKTIAYDGQDGKNALDLLKVDHKVETQDSSLGSFVTSIDGTANTDDTFWMFYVNNELASTGADAYETKSADKIEWKFEQFQ